MKGRGRGDVDESFGARTREKGREYFEEGRVLELLVDGDKVAGRVMGSAGQPYEVELTWGDRISSRCSCPVGSMCKHGAALALAFLSDRTERTDLGRMREEVRRLDEREAKRLLAECMAREPRLIALLQAAGDGPRAERTLDRLDRILSSGGRCGHEVPSGREIDLEIEGARSWKGEDADRDRTEVALQTLEMLLDCAEEGWDEYEDDWIYEAGRSCIDLLGDSLGSASEEDLADLLDRLIGLDKQDEYEVGAALMLDAVAERMGPEGLMKLLDRGGAEGGPGSRGERLKGLAVQEFRRSGDPVRAAELLAGGGATRRERLHAAEMLIEGGEHGRARELLRDHGWDKGDLQRASLLLRAGGGAPLDRDDVDVPGLLRSLDRSASGRYESKDTDRGLEVLRSVLDEEELLRNVRGLLPDGPAKLVLLAKLGRCGEMEALYLRDPQRYQYETWGLVRACTDPKTAGRMALRAASEGVGLMFSEEKAALLAAIRDCDARELKQVSKLRIDDQGLMVSIFDSLAERDPGLAGEFLKERFGQIDLEHVMLAIDHLGRKDRKGAVDVGMSWVRRKLDRSPRYEYIRAVLLKVKEAAGAEEWKAQKKALRGEYADRKKLAEVLDRIG